MSDDLIARLTAAVDALAVRATEDDDYVLVAWGSRVLRNHVPGDMPCESIGLLARRLGVEVDA